LILRFGDSIQPTASLAPVLLKFYLPIAVRPGLAFETWDWESAGGPGRALGQMARARMSAFLSSSATNRLIVHAAANAQRAVDLIFAS